MYVLVDIKINFDIIKYLINLYIIMVGGYGLGNNIVDG